MNYDDALAWLTRFMEDTNYYTRYPTRRYHKRVLDSDKTPKQKVAWLVSDGLLQTELCGDVLSSIDMGADPLEYFEQHIQLI